MVMVLLIVSPDRSDLGAMAQRLARSVAMAEEPVLAEHGLSMWEYVVLGALASGPSPTQLDLARLTGRDPTRLIKLLDTLEERSLLRRAPDPGDRRRRLVDLTATGRQLHHRCQTAVRDLEERLLADVAREDQAVFRDVLARLTYPERPHRELPRQPER